MDAESILIHVRSELAAGRPAADLRLEVLGRKGTLTALLRELGTIPVEERQSRGPALHAARKEIESLLDAADSSVPALAAFDVTIPPAIVPSGTVHPISAMIEEMVGIFSRLGFEVAEGPELVSDQENFEDLNLGSDHPARDGHDSFYVDGSLLLRTQTTAVQVLEMRRRMRRGELPIRIVVPGKTYRRESDQTHAPMFHQIDAVVVDTQTTFADLRGSLQYFTERLFGDAVETRFRPHHFPFTEPSAEMDIRFKDADPSEGKHAGWLEFGGCGMIHPNVLKRAGINPKVYQGWAFGMSIERPLMVRHGIADLRALTKNDVRLSEQLSYS